MPQRQIMLIRRTSHEGVFDAAARLLSTVLKVVPRNVAPGVDDARRQHTDRIIERTSVLRGMS